MNVRLKENSLRLRVTQSDLERFRKAGRVAQITRFGGSAALTCTLEADAEAAAPHVHFEGDRLTIRVPEDLARAWATTDRVGFEAEHPTTAHDAPLRLSVEKDLGCQHKADPERDDKFTELVHKDD